MSKVLIVNHSLMIGGGERLVYELVKFALEKDLKPYVLIVDNYSNEYYDAVLEKMNVPVIRTRLDNLWALRNPKNIIKALFWKIKLKFFAADFDSIHIINLYLADKIKDSINHEKRFFWNITNSIQYPESKLPFSSELFSSKSDTVVFINKYQIKEIEKEYGSINCAKLSFKLFIT